MTLEVCALSRAKVFPASAVAAGVNELATSANLTLDELASAIQAEMDKFHCKKVGLYLIQAKKLSTKHGQFMQFVKENLPEIPHRTATAWMKLAAGTQETDDTDGLNRETVSADDRAKKKLAAALKTLADITPVQAERLDQVHLKKLVNM